MSTNLMVKILNFDKTRRGRNEFARVAHKTSKLCIECIKVGNMNEAACGSNNIVGAVSFVKQVCPVT